MDFPGLLLAALLCAEVAAVGLACHAARTVRPNATTDARSSVRETSHSGARETGSPVASRRAAGLPAFAASPFAPLVLLLAFSPADELAQVALHAALDGAPRPLAGWYRAGWHVSVALSLGWPAALVLATWATKAACPRSLPGTDPRLNRASSAPWPAQGRCERSTARSVADILLGAYLGALAGLAIVYPPSRASLRWTLLTWELACVAVAWWGLWRARGRTWGAAEVCLVVLVACESAVVVVGPFASDPFTRWWIARAFYLGAWGLVSAVLVKSKPA
ncbi:MAG: hypothetical protein BWZ09_02099 [Alphaproteobacteria bacterium ADurb.BinA305]|nr:MAG: hypothetical protein BWZ09_02099 [Alphaproteobacteria bacterium ADurb.BinA305]